MEIIASLEIGSSQVTCLVSQMKEDGHLEVLGVGVESCDVLNQGHLINIDAAAKAIESAVKKAELMSGVEVEELHLGIPARVCEGIYSEGMVSIYANNGEREVDLDDIERVIEMAESVSIPTGKTIIHNIPSGFKVDGNSYEEPMGVIGVRLEVSVYLVVCSESVLDGFSRAVDKAGYGLADITLETLAATEAVLTSEEKKSNNIVIYLGDQYTSVVQYVDRSLAGLTSIEWGGHHIVKDLSYGLKTTFEEATRVKKEYGVADPDLVEDEKVRIPMVTYNKFMEVSKRGIAQIIAARMEEIFVLVREQMEKMSPDCLKNAGMVLIGENAQIQGCEQLAERLYQIPCRVGSPLAIGGMDKEMHRSDRVTTVGLARIAFDKMKMEEYQESSDARFKSKGEGFKKGRKIGKMTEYLKKFFG